MAQDVSLMIEAHCIVKITCRSYRTIIYVFECKDKVYLFNICYEDNNSVAASKNIYKEVMVDYYLDYLIVKSTSK